MIGSVAVVGAPSGIGIRPYDDGGVRRLDLAPGALREQGLVARLAASDLGDVMPPLRYPDLVRPSGRGRNEADVAGYTLQLAERIAAAIGDGWFVLLLGGDCSILLGALLGLRQLGRSPIGLVYIDAHSDFATLEESPSGSACSMNLALAVGRADTPLSRLGGRRPLVRAQDVVHIGSRDKSQSYGHSALSATGVLDASQRVIDTNGIGAVVAKTLARVSRIDAGYWIHFDVDVIDPELMPAVDSPIPGGLDFDDATALLAPLIRHPKALGLQLSIYDPTLDTRGDGARQLADMLEQAFAEARISCGSAPVDRTIDIP